MSALALIVASFGALGYLAALVFGRPALAFLAALLVAAFTFLSQHEPHQVVELMAAGAGVWAILAVLRAETRSYAQARIRERITGNCGCPNCRGPRL